MLQTIRSKLPETGLKLDPRMSLIGLALIDIRVWFALSYPIYAIGLLLIAAATVFFMPETKGVPLEEMEHKLGLVMDKEPSNAGPAMH